MGKRWKISCFNDKTYLKKIGDGTHAVAILEDRHIYIKRSSLNKETIIHELVHAYFHEMSYVELSLDDDQVEEMICELISKNGANILKDASKIFSYFSRNKK